MNRFVFSLFKFAQNVFVKTQWEHAVDDYALLQFSHRALGTSITSFICTT